MGNLWDAFPYKVRRLSYTSLSYTLVLVNLLGLTDVLAKKFIAFNFLSEYVY